MLARNVESLWLVKRDIQASMKMVFEHQTLWEQSLSAAGSPDIATSYR
ncbi:hypothetical protein IGI42_001256 [Enterococcus sp. AZ109]